MKISDLKIAVARKKLLSTEKPKSADPDSRKMAVLLEADDDKYLKPFLQLKKDFQLASKDFNIVICRERGSKNAIFEYPFFSIKDFGWNGSVKPEISEFLDATYDVVISFTADENKMTDFLVSVIRARLKIGRKSGDKNDIFDLNISAALSKPEVFIEELKKYLKIIKNTA